MVQGFIPLQLIPFVLLEKVLWHDNSACTVKSTHLKVFVEAIWAQLFKAKDIVS